MNLPGNDKIPIVEIEVKINVTSSKATFLFLNSHDNVGAKCSKKLILE